jgi:signal transduction histidine kinase
VADPDGCALARCQVNVRSLIGTLLTTYGPMSANQVVFDSITHDAVPEYLKLDSLRIRQVLANGVTNALKYTEEGHVLLQVRRGGGVHIARSAVLTRWGARVCLCRSRRCRVWLR